MLRTESVDRSGEIEVERFKTEIWIVAVAYWESDNTEYEYQIEVSSDDIHWKAVASQRQTGQEMGMDEFHETGIRYVRIVVTDVSKGLPSFYVVKVFGKEM